MAEQLDPPAAAVQVSPIKIAALNLDWDAKTIIIKLALGNNRFRAEVYTPEMGAEALIIALNKANLSVKSLQRRILEKLVADGRMDGTISGTVD
jgi:hypothetical protein